MTAHDHRPAHQCPHCGEQIRRLPDNQTHYQCPRCRVRYLVMIDEETGATAFVDQTHQPTTPPLGLPPGSVRALVALAMVGSCTMLVARGADVPGALASLLLAVIGFYFGFRTKAATLSDRIYDPAARRELPLYLPSGVIRTLVIAGVVATAVLLYRRERLLEPSEHLEFFVVLAGLIGGYYFGKVFRFGSPGARAVVGHLKALLVLAVAAWATALFLSDLYPQRPTLTMVLCAAISFYYGTRT